MGDIRDQIETGFSDFGRLVSRRPWIFIVGSILVVIAMTSQLPKIRMDTSWEGILHKEDPAIQAYDTFREQFGRDQMAIIGLKPKEVFDTEFLIKLRAFHETLENEVPYMEEITSLVNTEYIRSEADDLIVEDLLNDIPVDGKKMLELKNRVLANPLYRDILISADGTFTVITIKPVLLTQKDSNEFSPLSESELAEFINIISTLCERFRSPDFPIFLGGDTAFEIEYKKLTMKTMKFITIIDTLIIVAIFTFLFRRLSGVLLPMFVVYCSLLSTLGLMAVFGIPITLNTSILPMFLLAVGICDSVHILAIYYKHLKQNGDRSEAISFALGHSGLAVVMTSMTTAAGLLSFAGSGIAPVAHLGIFAAVGVMLALAFTIATLPALLAITPIKKKDLVTSGVASSRLDDFLAGIGDMATAHPWKVVSVSAFLLIGALLLAFQLNFSHNGLKYFREDMPVRRAVEIIDEKMRGSANLEVLLDTGTPQGLYDPDILNKIAQAQEMAESLLVDGKQVGRASAVTDIVREINKVLHNSSPSEYRVPDDRGLIAQELLLYEVGGGQNLDRVVDRDYSLAR